MALLALAETNIQSSFTFICFLIVCSIMGFITTSEHDLRTLLDKEGQLLNHLTQIASAAADHPSISVSKKKIARLNITIECLRRKHLYLVREPGILDHPVSSFRFLRRITEDWNDVMNLSDIRKEQAAEDFIDRNLMNMRDVVTKWRVWPTRESHITAALSLIRIGRAYNLYPKPSHWKKIDTEDHFDRQVKSNFIRHKHNKKQCKNENLNNLLGKAYRSHTQTKPISQCFHSQLNKYNVNTDAKQQISHDTPYTKDMIKTNEVSSSTELSLTQLNWLPPVDCTPDVNLKSISKRKHNTHPPTLNTNNDHQCPTDYYYYETLEPKDFHFIAKVSRENMFCREAKIWRNLADVSTLTLSTPTKDFHFQSPIDVIKTRHRFELEKRIPEIDDTHTDRTCKQTAKDRSYENHQIYRQFAHLCKESVQETRKVETPGNLCCWRFVWPYDRFKEEIISSDPEISRFYDVVSVKDMKHVIDTAREKLSVSTLSDDIPANQRGMRVSRTAWLADTTLTLKKLSSLVGFVTGLDTGQRILDTPSEMWQVVNYTPGGLYAPHEDSVRAARQTAEERKPRFQNSGDRIATWMFYLNDVRVGGATVFPALNISIIPIKGSAVLWYNLLRNGQPDSRLVHGGCPVVIGEKWIANKWIRETSQAFYRPCLLNKHL